MKTGFTLLLLLPLFVFAQQTDKKISFTLNGAVTGLTDGTEVKITNTNDNTEVAKAKVVKGKFSVTGKIDEPSLFYVVLGKQQPQHIFLESKTMTITGDVNKPKELKITGSRSHQDFVEFRDTFNPLFGELNGVAAEINKSMPGPRYDELMVKYDSLGKVIQVQIDKFVSSKPSSYVSPFLLFVTAQISDDVALMEKRFNGLTDEIKQSTVGK
ncbi:MAG: DUF4369 domain-containing protein, partial [Bacteroidota bacterium]